MLLYSLDIPSVAMNNQQRFLLLKQDSRMPILIAVIVDLVKLQDLLEIVYDPLYSLTANLLHLQESLNLCINIDFDKRSMIELDKSSDYHELKRHIHYKLHQQLRFRSLLFEEPKQHSMHQQVCYNWQYSKHSNIQDLMFTFLMHTFMKVRCLLARMLELNIMEFFQFIYFLNLRQAVK